MDRFVNFFNEIGERFVQFNKILRSLSVFRIEAESNTVLPREAMLRELKFLVTEESIEIPDEATKSL